MSQRHLRIALAWRGTIIEERLLSPEESLHIGLEPGDLNIPVPGIDRALLVAPSPDGTEVRVPAHGSAQAHRDGTTKIGRAGDHLTLGDPGWCVIEVGPCTVFLQWVERPRAHALRALAGRVDFNLMTAVFFTLAVHLVFVLNAFLSYQPDPTLQAFEVDERTLSIFVAPPPEAEEPLEALDAPEDQTTADAAGGPEGALGSDEPEVTETVTPNREGPLVDRIETTGLGRAFNAAIAESGALTSVFGNSDLFAANFGADFATAGVGDAFVMGPGGPALGRLGSGPGGPGDGFGRARGLGELDTGGGEGIRAGRPRREQREREVRVSLSDPDTRGGFLSREQIERVVRRHRRGLAYCYQSELQNDTELAGRITLTWTIGLDGRVEQVSTAEDTIGHNGVEDCVHEEIERMRFDEPDGGMVVVTYPFTFRPAD